jgi:hypothetical protein
MTEKKDPKQELQYLEPELTLPKLRQVILESSECQSCSRTINEEICDQITLAVFRSFHGGENECR